MFLSFVKCLSIPFGFAIDSGAAASSARLSGGSKDTGTVAAETSTGVFAVSTGEQRVTSVSLSGLAAASVVICGLITVREKSAAVNIFLSCSRIVVVNDRFFVAPKVLFPCHGSAGSSQAVKDASKESSFLTSHFFTSLQVVDCLR